jgi:hypothetical protein
MHREDSAAGLERGHLERAHRLAAGSFEQRGDRRAHSRARREERLLVDDGVVVAGAHGEGELLRLIVLFFVLVVVEIVERLAIGTDRLPQLAVDLDRGVVLVRTADQKGDVGIEDRLQGAARSDRGLAGVGRVVVHAGHGTSAAREAVASARGTGR